MFLQIIFPFFDVFRSVFIYLQYHLIPLFTFRIISPQPLHFESPYLLIMGFAGHLVSDGDSLFEHTKNLIVGGLSEPLSMPNVLKNPPHRTKAGQFKS